MRLHEKGDKVHSLPCHHNLETWLDDYIAAAPASKRKSAATRSGRPELRAYFEKRRPVMWKVLEKTFHLT